MRAEPSLAAERVRPLEESRPALTGASTAVAAGSTGGSRGLPIPANAAEVTEATLNATARTMSQDSCGAPDERRDDR